MLHNMKMIVASCLTILPIYPKKGKEVEKVMIIFVKASIKTMTWNITLVCECISFFTQLTFMISITICLFSQQKLNGYFYVSLFYH